MSLLYEWKWHKNVSCLLLIDLEIRYFQACRESRRVGLEDGRHLPGDGTAIHRHPGSLRTSSETQADIQSHLLTKVLQLPETPRWYIQHGKIEQARKSLARVRDTEQEVEDEALMIREAIEFEKEAISSNYSALWKDKSIRHRLILALILNAGQQITGQGSLNSYSSISTLIARSPQASYSLILHHPSPLAGPEDERLIFV